MLLVHSHTLILSHSHTIGWQLWDRALDTLTPEIEVGHWVDAKVRFRERPRLRMVREVQPRT